MSGLMLSVNAQLCKKFSDKYPSGESLPTDLWYGAFTYEEDETKAYDMWFEDASNNPNDALTKTFVDDEVIVPNDEAHFNEDGLVDVCYLDYGHKDDEELDNSVHPEED